MGDQSISIVPKRSDFPAKEIKAKEILDWLVSLDIVKPTPSNCILAMSDGYEISKGAIQITNNPDLLPFSQSVNGLEIIKERQVFHTGQNGIEKLICPSCRQDISNEDWDFLNEWAENNSNDITCPLCRTPGEIHNYECTPEWGFSDLGFTFWNWPPLTDDFLNMFRQMLQVDLAIVYTKI
jgi:hypothetical protein